MKKIHVIGIASGLGANNPGCRYGPARVKRAISRNPEIELEWDVMLHPRKKGSKEVELMELQERIIRQIVPIAARQNQFLVIGGDHSSAMGVWQGTLEALHPNRRFGLLWIDAHPDLQTFASSPTGNVHDMPLAALLGQGDTQLSRIYGNGPNLDPKNLVILGVRTFKPEEMQLIKHLGVDYYEMASLKQPGSFRRVLHSVLAQMRRQCDCYGISLDLDAIDPLEAPGVGTPEPNGIPANAIRHALKDLGDDAHLVGIEIAEYNPLFDKHQQTLRLIIELVTELFGDAIKPKRLLGLSSTGTRSTSRLMFNSAARR